MAEWYMTTAVEALTPWLNHPRRTIIRVEALVAAAALLLLQLILGCCRRRWHNFFIKYGLQASTTVMNPLIIYTLGTMHSSPIKNSAYPVWAAFLITASAGTTAIRQYDFYDSLFKKCMQVCGEYFRDFFYAMMMFYLLADPNTYTWKTAWDLKRRLKNDRASSGSVMVFVCVILFTKSTESVLLVFLGYKNKSSLFITKKKNRRTQVAEPGTGESDSDPQSMNSYKYEVYYRLGRLITIDQIWDYYGNSDDDGKALLKDLCLDWLIN